MQFLYKSKNFLLINKPVGVPSQSDPSGDPDAMTLASAKLAESGEDSTLFLVHRLDRVVGGVIAFARNKKAAAALSSIIGTEKFVKEYLAVVEGKAEGSVLTDLVYKDAMQSKAFVVDKPRKGVKEAILSYEPLSFIEQHTLVRVRLSTGRFHQIRVQFSSRKMPLVGDKKYGSRDTVARAPALFAHRLSFSCLGEKIDIKSYPECGYPWCNFDLFREDN